IILPAVAAAVPPPSLLKSVQAMVEGALAPVQPVIASVGLDVTVSSPAPVVVPDIRIAAQIEVATNSTPTDPGVQLQVGPATLVAPSPDVQPATVGVSLT